MVLVVLSACKGAPEPAPKTDEPPQVADPQPQPEPSDGPSTTGGFSPPRGYEKARVEIAEGLDFAIAMDPDFDAFETESPVPFQAALLRGEKVVSSGDSLSELTRIPWETWAQSCEQEWVPMVRREMAGETEVIRMSVSCATGADVRSVTELVTLFAVPEAAPSDLAELEPLFSGFGSVVRTEMGICEWGLRASFEVTAEKVVRKRLPYHAWDDSDTEDCNRRMVPQSGDTAEFARGSVESSNP